MVAESGLSTLNETMDGDASTISSLPQNESVSVKDQGPSYEIEEMTIVLPNDVSTLCLILKRSPTAYIFSAFIYVIQLYLLSVLCWEIQGFSDGNTVSELSIDRMMEMLSMMGGNTKLQIRIAQYIAVLLSFLGMEGTIVSFSRLLQCPFNIRLVDDSIAAMERGDDMSVPRSSFILSILFRTIIGILALITKVLLTFTSTGLLQIILNFAAVSFISELDVLGLRLAARGYVGPHLQELATLLQNVEVNYLRRPSRCLNQEWSASLCLLVVVIIPTMFVAVGLEHDMLHRSFTERIGAGCAHIQITFDNVVYRAPPNLDLMASLRDLWSSEKYYFIGSNFFERIQPLEQL